MKRDAPRAAGALQVRDVIRQITSFRQEVQAWRAAVSTQQASDPRSKFLLAYIDAHESHVDACLAEYASEKANALLDTWLPYSADTSLPERDTLRSDLSLDEVIETTFRIDRELMRAYERLASAPLLPPRVRELFASLLDLEVSKERAIAMASLDA